MFETIARERPLVVLLEDVNWAEPTLLELIEHIAEWSRDAPIMLLCSARDELLDMRPTWGGGLRNATTAFLEPLSEFDSEELIGHLATISRSTKRRLAGWPCWPEATRCSSSSCWPRSAPDSSST